MLIDKNIIIPNIKKFNNIKSNIIEGGFSKLHIISDFDRTLTKYKVNSKKALSLIAILREENLINKNYSLEAKRLFEKYHPIEINPNLSLEEKSKFMEKWWTESTNLLIKYKLKKDDLIKIAKSNRIEFRKYLKESLEILNENNVPFIILSASSIGVDSITITLKYHKFLFPNIKIISNKLIWNENNILINYEKPLIHTFNKNEKTIKNSEIYNKIKNRKNVILIGDSLGDVRMIEGFEYENLLKIGFLNYKQKELIKEYKKYYDLIIINDGNFKILFEILKQIK
jgi:5'-nucleotidase